MSIPNQYVSSFQIVSNSPLDWYRGPWVNLAAAKTAIKQSFRHDGLTVMITGEGEYQWTAADLTDNGLIKKFISAGNGIALINNVVELGGSLIKHTKITGNYNLELGNVNNEINNFNVYGKTSLNNKIVGFNTGGNGFDSQVISTIILSDGKIIVGGNFYTYNGNILPSLAKLNTDGSIDNTFNTGTGFNNEVRTIKIQSDGKLLVGGWFNSYNGVDCPDKLVRLNTDGSLDTSFNASGSGFNNAVFDIKIQSDGKILVGGYFTTYNGVTCSNRMVRLNADGSIDPTFNSGGTGFNNGINFISIQSDGKILVGGFFVSYNGVDCPDRIARLNVDGSLDTTFNSGGSGFGGGINFISTQSDGKIIVGGYFTTYNGVNCPDMLVRLNANGTLDTTFNSGGSGFDGEVNSIQIQSDDKIIVGGTFTIYNGVTGSNKLVRLNADGSLDTTFNTGGTGFNNDINFIIIQSDGKLLVGGNFTTYNGVTGSNRMIRLNTDGSLIISIDNKVLFNGAGALRYGDNYHSQYTNRSLVDKEYIDNLIPTLFIFSNGLTQTSNRIELGGSLTKNTLISGRFDLSIGTFSNPINNFNVYGKTLLNNKYGGFNVGGNGFDNRVRTISIQSDGKLLVGGEFTTYNGVTGSNKLVRLNTDGSLDATFNIGGSGFNTDGSYVEFIQIQSDDKLLVGGNFTTYNGVNCPDMLVRLNANGTLDTTFNSSGSGFNGLITTIKIQSDGKLLVGGWFDSYNGINCPDRLIRLNANGSLDTTFNTGGSGFNSPVLSTSIQSDGKILVGGFLTTYNGVDCPDYLVRLNSSGSLDTTFNTGGSGFDNLVLNILIQSDGKLLVGGDFNSYNGVDCPDRIARLNVDGSLDTTFNASGSGFNNENGNRVRTIIMQSDGKLLVGGYFTTYNGVTCPAYLVRLNANGTLDTSFNSSGTGFDNTVFDIKIQSDGKLLVGGDFTTYNGVISSNKMVRLNSNGSLESLSDNRVLLSGLGALRYESNYHNQYTNRSLVDKEYVDINISGNSITAGNGLILSTGIVELGGLLTKHTLISGTFDLSIGNSTNSINNFDVFSNTTFNNIIVGFNPAGIGFDFDTRCIAKQSDGKLLVGGQFTTYNGVNCTDYLVRLNANGTIDTTFNTDGTGFGGSVSSIAILSDGKILVGGQFTNYNGVDCPDFLVRLNANGTLDTTFNTGGSGFSSPTLNMVIQSDGKILICGYFNSYNGIVVQTFFTRLNADGTIDTTFNNGGVGFNSPAKTLAIQSDGKILVGGFISTYNGVDCPDFLVRLNANGTLDTTFNTGGVGFDNPVDIVSIQSDGKILVGGQFTTYNTVACPDRLVRLNTNGTLDTTFNTSGVGFDADIFTLAIQSDGKILVGGNFLTYNAVACPDRLVRLNTNGTLDTTFNTDGTGFDLQVNNILISDNKILICGNFTTYNGLNCSDMLVRLNTNGTLDASVDNKVILSGLGGLRYGGKYHTQYTNRSLIDKEYLDITLFNNSTTANNGLSMNADNITVELGGSLTRNTLIQGNYNLDIGGLFNEINSFDTYAKTSLNTLSQFFNKGGSGFNSAAITTTILPDGKLLVGGGFTTYNGIVCLQGLVRLNTNGKIDTTFNVGGTGFNDSGSSVIKILPDGKLLVGGQFTTYNGVDCPNGLVMLNTDGTLYPTFNVGGSGIDNVSGNVISILILDSGKILISGNISSYNGVICSSRLIRLNANGTLDSTFNSGGTGFGFPGLYAVNKIRLQSNGKIIAVGTFNTYNGIDCSDMIARLNTDGTLDTTFNVGGSGFNNSVIGIEILSNDKILLVGNFLTYNGVNCSDGCVRLNSDGTIDSTFNSGGTGFSDNIGGIINNFSVKVLSDSKILVGGNFNSYNGTICPKGLARLNSDGTIDSTFNAGGIGIDISNSVILSTEILPNDKILIGGNFTTYNGIETSHYYTRLHANGYLDIGTNTKVILNDDGALRYESNYHIQYTNRSIPDVEYVLNAISSGTTPVLQLANTFYRGPVSGAAALPTFGSLVLADMPAFTGYIASPGKVLVTDTAFTAVQKLDGNIRSISYSYIGNIISIPIWTSQSSNFTKIGSVATFTYGTSLAIANVTPITTAVTDYITYDPLITNYEDWTISGTITAGTVDANSKGLYFGLTSQVTGFLYDFGAAFIFDSVDGGSIELYYNKSTSGKIISPNKIVVVTGGIYTFTFTRKISQFIATITDSTGNSINLSYDLSLAFPAANTRINPNAGKFTIGSLGGSFNIGPLSVDSNMPVGFDRCIIGDSIMDGVFIEDPSQRMAAQLQDMINERIIVYAQPGNLIQSATASELIALKCTYYHIAIGTNNFTVGETPATIASRITTLISALTAGGILSANIFVHSLLPRNSSVVAVNSQLKTTFGAQYKDFYTSFTGIGTNLNVAYSDDTLHLNYIGQNKYAKEFFSLFKLKTKSNAQFESFAMHNPLKMAIGAKDYTPYSKLDVIDTAWQIRVGANTNDEGGYIGSVLAGNISFAGGTRYNGTNFIAKNTSANIYNANNNAIEFYIDSGLTVGTIFTPTRRAQITDTQFNVFVIPTFTQNLSGGAQFNITNSNTGNGAYMYVPISAGSSNGGITQYPTTYSSSAYLSGKTAFFNLAGTGVILQGATVHLNAGGATTNVTYRNSDGTADLTANILFGASGSALTGYDWLINQTDGLVGTLGNGARRIAGIAFKPENVVPTVGLESMDLGIYTKSGAATPTLRATFGSFGLALNGGFATKTIRSSATTLTLDTTVRSYFFGGTSAATWTLPLITTSIGTEYLIKNTGTANITLVTQGSDLMYEFSTISSLIIPPGSAYILQNDGTYWEVM